MGKAIGLLWSIVLGAAAFAVLRTGFVNWDTEYALVWAQEVFSGRRPDFEDVALAPTTHPLADVVSLALVGLGDGAEYVLLALAFLALGVIGFLTYRLTSTWYGPLAGVAAAAIVLTREPVLSFGARAYVDVFYLALVLGAAVIEMRRPRAGASVLALLLLAGLLRPEAWLFSLAYLVWLALPSFRRARTEEEVAEANRRDIPVPRDETGEIDSAAYWAERRRRLEGNRTDPGEVRRRAIRLVPMVIAAPLLWALLDLATTGDLLASLSGTRDNVDTLGRATGIDALFSDAPRKLGEIMREPGLIAAALGTAVGLVWARSRTLAALVLVGLAALALAVIAIAGLPVITRYLLLEATLLCVLAGAAIGGWLTVPRGTPRFVWLGVGALSLILFAVYAPSQVDRIADLRTALEEQEQVTADLEDLADRDAFPAICRTVTVPNSRPVPYLAYWLDRAPDEFRTPGDDRPLPRRGAVLLPRDAKARRFILDDRDPGAGSVRRPRGFQRQAGNETWEVYARC